MYEEAQSIIETKSDVIPAEISLTGSEYSVPKPIVDATLKWIELKILRRKEWQLAQFRLIK